MSAPPANGLISVLLLLTLLSGAQPLSSQPLPGAYRVVGDAAFMAVEFPDPEEREDTLALLLRGDTLIMLNQVLGRNPLFIRED